MDNLQETIMGEDITVSEKGGKSGRSVGHGGALVETIAFNRRVVGSTPALAAM